MDNRPINDMTPKAEETFRLEIANELTHLLNWWTNHAQDFENGGFYGEIANDNLAYPKAPKGLVLHARILYTFSAAYLLQKRPQDLTIAKRAYNYLIAHFLDPIDGGFYWSVNPNGHKLDDKKQAYGQAFAIYGLAEYYKAAQEPAALEFAKTTFQLLEKHSFDPGNLGYIEASAHDWQPINDLRLSEKDQNEKKSMNTHLHIIEAYANLYTVWRSEHLKTVVKHLLSNFKQHIIDPKTHHLHLFFTETWEIKSSLISFGHDIEAAWLLQEAAEIIGDENEVTIFKDMAIKMAIATEKGLSPLGGLFHEYDPASRHWIKEFHWWPQAEAMVGFFNAFESNGEKRFLNHVFNSWLFIKNHLKDNKNGEWFWGVHEDGSIMQGEDKAGFWKCPYHNGRALMELMKRLAKL